MARLNVDNLKADLTNPARVYLWEVIIPNVIGGGADTDVLLLRAQSASIPGRSVGAIDVPFKQTGGIRYAGKLAYTHTWELQFIEGEDRKIFDAFYNWKQQVVHDRDGVSVGDENYITDVYLSLIQTRDSEWNRIKLINCYPQEVGQVGLAYNDEGAVIFPVTMAFTRWEFAG